MEKKKKKNQRHETETDSGHLRIGCSSSKCLLSQSFLSSLESSLLCAPARIVIKGRKEQKEEREKVERDCVRRRRPSIPGDVEKKERKLFPLSLFSFPHPMYVLFELGTARELSR